MVTVSPLRKVAFVATIAPGRPNAGEEHIAGVQVSHRSDRSCSSSGGHRCDAAHGHITPSRSGGETAFIIAAWLGLRVSDGKLVHHTVVLHNYNYTGFDQDFYKGGGSWLLNYEVKSKNAPILKRKETKV